jgi:hypothetical protein
MFRRGLFLRIVISLVIVGLLFVGGAGVYRLGWTQGYQTGALVASQPAAGQGGSPAAPVAPYYGYGYAPWLYGPHFWGFGFFPFFPLLGIGFFLIVFLLFAGLFRGLAFRRWAGGPGMQHWREEAEKEWRERHGKPEEPADK